MGLRLGFSKETKEIGKQEAFAVTGSYGQNIPYGFGTRMFEGKPLYAANIEEIVTKSSKKKGGFLGIGGHRVTTITYDYYATFAVWFCVGPTEKLSRLWLDDLLVYDGSAPPVSTTDNIAQDYPELLFRGQYKGIVAQEFSKKQELRIPYTFYRGTEDQPVDPVIQSIEGVGESPAYRGLSYIMFDRLKLQQFDNHVPKVRAEIVVNVGSGEADIDDFLVPFDTQFDGALQIDYKRGMLYCQKQVLNKMALTLIDLEGNLIRDVSSGDVFDDGPMVVDMENNQFYSRIATGSRRWNSFTGAMEINENSNTQPIMATGGGVMLYGEGNRHTFTTGFPLNTSFWHLITHDPDCNVADVSTVSSTGICVSMVTPAGASDARFGYAYTINATTDILRMYRADGADGALKSDFGDCTPAMFGLDDFTAYYGIEPSFPYVAYDEGNARVIGFISGNVGGVDTWKVFAWSETDGVIWATTVPFPHPACKVNTRRHFGWSRLIGGRFAWTNGTQVCAVELPTGQINSTYDGVNNGFAGIGNLLVSQHYDDATSKIYLWQSNVGLNPDELQTIQLFIGEAQGSSLADIVRKYAADSGLVEGEDFDVSAIASINVPGFVNAKTDEARKILDPLIEFYQVNVVDRDHRIYFEPRQTSPLATLSANDMVMDSVVIKREREEENSLPKVYEVEYVDRFRDYEKGLQRASRTSVPIASMGSNSTETFSIDIALDPSEAKRQVEKLLYASWIERNAYTFALPQKFLRFTPGDLVTLTQSSGYQSNVMMDKIAIGVNFSMKVHSIEQTVGMYVSVAKSATGNWTVPPAFLSVASEPFLLDIPFLTDEDANVDVTAGISLGYWAGSDYGAASGSWPGAFLYRSYDDTVYDQVDARKNRADWGILKAALPANPGGPFATDTTNVVSVFMTSGTLVPSERIVGESDLLSGLTNRAVILHADGTNEIIYFATVTQITDREFELSTLMRGRRGTDTTTVGAEGDRIVFLSDGEYDDDDSNYSFFANPITDTLTKDQFYKVVTRGLNVAEAESDQFNFTCADLKPWAPVHVQGWQQTTDDILIEWVRRARLGGELTDGIDVPLVEATEEYEIDIYNVAGNTVLRTLTSTIQSVVYEAADVLADQLTANPGTIKVGIYQMSATVGRGFGQIVTVEV